MSTKKSTTEKVASNKGPKMPIAEFFAQLADREAENEGDDEGEVEKGKIWHILKAYVRGYSKKEIVSYGNDHKAWSKVTVYRQTREYDILRHAPATHYQGFEVFEMRVKRLMANKKVTREEAVELIYAKDLE